jgi:hypothetical protein
VIPLKGDPPEEYQIEYRLRTLVMSEQGTLEYATACAVHVWLPPNFPHEAPLVRPISPLFHPNIVPQGINIDRAWTGPTSTIADVVRAVGAMVCLQDYDVDAVWNEMAMEWILANPRYVPVDMEANLAFDAGGEALSRIMRFGPRTLEQVRTQLKQTCDALIAAEGAPAAKEVAALASRTRQALGLFVEEDVPEEIRAPAAELDEFARFLPETVPAWEGVRGHRALAASALKLSQQMGEIEQSLTRELNVIDGLVIGGPEAGVGQTIRMIPHASKLQLHQGNLDNLLIRAQQVAHEARQTAGRIAALPALSGVKATGALRSRLEAEIARTRDLVSEGNAKLHEAYQRLDPAAGQSKVHAIALKRMTDWRDYAELLEKAEAMARRLIEWGPAGLQAYFIESPSGRHGPFEMEQQLQLGSLNLAVRNPASTIIELVDGDTGMLLKRGEQGAATKTIPDPASGSRYAATFRLTGNCDELAVQMDYLIRETTRTLELLAADRIRSPEGWMGRFNEVLSAAMAGGRVRLDHEALVRRWSAVRDDVAALRPFKERLATFRLLQRTAELAPKLVRRLKQAEADLAQATDRVSLIVAGSNQDLETGRLLIPARYAREYPEQLVRRDNARLEIETIRRQMVLAAEDVRRRVDAPELRGSANPPALAILGRFPQAWIDIEPLMNDEALAQRLSELEGPLGQSLLPPDWGGATALSPAPQPSAEPSAAPTGEADPFAVEPPPLEPGEFSPPLNAATEHGQADAPAEQVEELEVVEDDYVDLGDAHPPQPDPHRRS